MEKTILTGVSRVAKESIFSGANNFDVYTILDNEFSEDFGITSDEIDIVLKDFGIEENTEEIKKWYDGYRIGNTEGIYNPWSILKYLKQRELVKYWAKTPLRQRQRSTKERTNIIFLTITSLPTATSPHIWHTLSPRTGTAPSPISAWLPMSTRETSCSET